MFYLSSKVEHKINRNASRSSLSSTSASDLSSAAGIRSPQVPYLSAASITMTPSSASKSMLASYRDLLPGDKVLAVSSDSVTHLCPFNGNVSGNLTVTHYQLVFEGSNGPSFTIPLCTIEKVDKMGGKTSRGENAYGIEIQCKDLRTIRLAFKQEGVSRRVIFDCLSKHAFPLSSSDGDVPLFAFLYQGIYPSTSGWRIYDVKTEFARQGLPPSWRISEFNSSYDPSPTYPALIVAPSTVSDESLHRVSHFRSRGRIPALSWICPTNGASITRCSQPKVGVAGKRSADDEALIQAIIDANTTDRSKLFIVDARPKANAMANQAKGLGFEYESFYPRTEIIFSNIHNIHAMRDSIRKMREICFPSVDDSHWFANLEATLWLKHIKTILVSTVFIIESITRGTSVLVHCSDGWDRTAQLTGLSMLCMDPYYRTIQGFEVLIEKEWLSFGHKFAQRIGHGRREFDDDQRSPVFLQFIDCVWQLQQQFPCSFEFNSSFLLCILDHLYSCLFGTFLHNTECERVRDNLAIRTRSLWDHIDANTSSFTNPFYSGPQEKPQVLIPVASMRKLSLWTDYYLRWNPNMKPRESVEERTTELKAMAAKLQQQYDALVAQLKNTHTVV